MVIGSISHSHHWLFKCTGVRSKSNNKTWRLVFHWILKEDASLNAQKGGERWITFILKFSNLEYHQLPLPVICFKNDHYMWRPSRDNLENAAPISNVLQKSTNSRVQQSMFMLLYALFISFPVRHTVNFRSDGRHCIGDVMAHTIIRKVLYSKFDRKGSIQM